MALVRDLSQAQLAFQVSGRDVDEFEVLRYRGSEGLNRLYRFEIELASSREQLALADFVGQSAVLSINAAGGQRFFHGLTSRFELTGETAAQTYFRAELVPAIWLLTHRYNCRIFQNKTVAEIITEVLTQAGIASDRFRLSLSGQYEPREYCVQYRETDFNFICRMMEEEGIWFHFEQSEGAHVLVVADASSAYAPIEGEVTLPYHPPTGMNVDTEHVFRFRLGQSVRPGAVVLDDFNFENPKLNLQSTADNGRDTHLEFSDYPGEYLDQGRGRSLAQLRAQEFESGRILGVGQSNCHRLSPGRTFELIEFPGGTADGSYLVTAVSHEGKQATTRASTGANGRVSVLDARIQQSLLAARQHQDGSIRELAEGLLQISRRLSAGDETAHRALTQWLYHAGQVTRDLPSAALVSGGDGLEALSIPNLLDDIARVTAVEYDAPVYQCRFECIPSSVGYRPPRVTPWPVMRGTQTARVVGPSGEEIHTDQYGRVKVQFNWDRDGQFDDNSSCWIRVSQGFAGGNYGIMFLPRVGQEVIVDFLEGDPDKPIIVGRVYNADHMPPYKLPDEKTKSVIKTHSSKGGGGTNEIRIEDLKDSEQILIYAQKNLHIRVNNDRVENVAHDHHLTVKENKFELIKKGKNSEVKLDFSEKVGGNRSLKVVGDLGEEIGGNFSAKVGGNYYVKAGGGIVIEAGSGLTLCCGGNFVKIDASGVTILGTTVKINSGGAAGTGTAVSLKTPEAPVDADSAQPGKDTTYSRTGQQAEGEAPPDQAGTAPEAAEEETDSSWIEIELVDEAGQPVPGEAYEITCPDGETIRRGNLDQRGQAHVSVPTSGSCQISFPNLDQAAWVRGTGGTQAAGAGPGASAASSAGPAPASPAAGAATQATPSGGAGQAAADGPYDDGGGPEEPESPGESEYPGQPGAPPPPRGD